ncbi:signal transduction histidine kinase [Flavobacterium sp. 90]|uniref:sensor histidine kinase n=1 Tax=unclassified Flavobacterium TaxID=196869 RepID=UPI000F109ED7|nr:MULTISPECIES: HAMP domain-containing sensor histidine kinase [unclassified Flavobacterium]RKR08383.1 signal transduction histidine kinase [Flavobacterium sp. 81]TCK57571.1 signal transduction histidine kinase [Flavobacterium sp. 90]
MFTAITPNATLLTYSIVIIFMKLYHNLSQIGFLKKSYVFKFLFVAFIGIHIPLIGILFFVIFSSHTISPISILIFALIMTLLATLVTLLVLKQLIKPIVLASKSLDDYRNNRQLSVLPTEYSDEAGLLMCNIQESIYESESFINEKQDLIYMLSHDLKNFAGNPQGLAQLILSEEPSDSIKHLAELICESTNLQFRYIENFIKLLKEQDQIVKVNHDPKNIVFPNILPFINEQLEQRLLDKNIKLSLSLELVEAKLKIDEGLLVQVLVNLISNAIKFSYFDSEIKVRIFIQSSNLIITVIDKGIGFDKTQIDELFKKFTKMSRLGTANELSTGIGLYLCKKIIERNKGKLSATSEGKNKGAEFKIEFEL